MKSSPSTTSKIVLLSAVALAACGALWCASCANESQYDRVATRTGAPAAPTGTRVPSTSSAAATPWSPAQPGNSTVEPSGNYAGGYTLELDTSLQQAGQTGGGGSNFDGYIADPRVSESSSVFDSRPSNEVAELLSSIAGVDESKATQNPVPVRTDGRNTTSTPANVTGSVPLLGDIPLSGNVFLSRDVGRTASTHPAAGWAKDLLSSANTEVWVIAKPPTPPPVPDDDTPGTGCIVTTLPIEIDPQQRRVPVPLEHTAVNASIAGHLSGVEVTQRFHNPYASKIEAVYVFPLPENAAVSEFVMTIGDRHIRGIIRDRAEAEQVYHEARAQGYVASLMTQERANIFTQKVANIEPGKTIDVSITYFGPLTYSDGAFEFVFPMVVGPRFNPPGTTDGIGAAARGGAGSTRQPTEVQYLKPSERSGHDVSVAVTIDVGLPIARIESVNHAVETQMRGTSAATVTLSRHDTLPNKDFVLRVHVAGDRVQSTLLTMADERDPTAGYFNLLLVPPSSLQSIPRGPVEMVFVLDCSGSMNGRPIEQAKEAIERGLARMQPGDSFQLINFSNDANQLGATTLDASPANIRRAREYLASVRSEGGTYMVEGIKAALNFPTDDLRPRHVAFLTDGFIGNEDDVLRNLYAGLGTSRVFSFGVGSSPNRALMDSMARMGRGVAAYLSPSDSSGEVMDQFFDRVSYAAMTNVRIQGGSSQGDGTVCDVFPSRIPDVFVGRPVVIVGRYTGAVPTSLTIRGRCGGQDVSIVAEQAQADTALARKAIPRLWARAKLTELAEAALIQDRPEFAAMSRQTALDHSLMSAFTAFVAVDSSQRTAGTFGTTVAVPVPVPDGVRYDTTVPEGR